MQVRQKGIRVVRRVLHILVGAGVLYCLNSDAYALPKATLEIRVAEDGRSVVTAQIDVGEKPTFTVVYLLLPFPMRQSSPQVSPESWFSTTDTGQESSLTMIVVPPRTPSVKVVANPQQLVSRIDASKRKIELSFSYPNPPTGLDWLLQQENAIVRFHEIFLSLPDNVGEVAESKPSRWDHGRRRYSLGSEDDGFAVSWRGALSKDVIMWDSLSGLLLGIFMALGAVVGLYRLSNIVAAVVLTLLALLATSITVYRAYLQPNFPWNDRLPTAATFLGIFVTMTALIFIIKYKPARQE